MQRTRASSLTVVAGLVGLLAVGTAAAPPDRSDARSNPGAGAARADVATVSPAGFLATFDGQPGEPTPWRPTDWDVQIHSRQTSSWRTLDSMEAEHGTNCAAPPAVHHIDSYEDAVFHCNDHVMTAINAVGVGYGAIYLTPNRLVDFSRGEAVVRFDLSTFRRSSRDWVDLWITPYDHNLALPLQPDKPDLNGPPREAVNILMDCGFGCPETYFRGFVYRGFAPSELRGGRATGFETFLVPDAARRDTFELRISRTRVRFGMPEFNQWWLDTSIADLGWDAGVVQFGHHSYTPDKDCSHRSFNGCPNTWHWDNVSIDPAQPFTIIRADRRFADADAPQAMTFPTPAPPDAHLRYAAAGRKLEVSVDGGMTWEPAGLQDQSPKGQGAAQDDVFKSYWQPTPEGTTSVLFRGEGDARRPWMVKDVSIWSLVE